MKECTYARFTLDLSDDVFVRGRWRTSKEHIDIGMSWIKVSRDE